MKRWLTPVGIALCALALSSCTLVATNATPVRIPPKNVQFSLLSPTIPGSYHARVRFNGLPVYFVDTTNNLTQLSRIVPSPPALATVVEQLLLGPTDIETSAGYTSALPKSLVVISANVVNNTGYINFATSLSARSRLARSRFSRSANSCSRPTKWVRSRASSSESQVSPKNC